MPLINCIEVANFMNRERRTPFEPTWPHAVFPLLGMNSIINVPNGRGKTTIVKLILFLLAGQKKEINKIRQDHFAPKSSGSYTHVRLQVILDTEEASGFDLLSGTPLGKQMVFGVYGRLGENEEYKMYSYHGDLEDCPVHRKDTGFSNRINLVPDKEFEAKLASMPYKFPASARETSADKWREEVEKWFDLAGLEQQIAYQNKAGGEGKSSYFDVGGKDSEFATNVFYERLAPELLHDVMGGHGEDDERNIEDTIHEKTRQVIHARLRNTETAKSLTQTSRVLREINLVCEMADEMTQSAGRLQANQLHFALELGALKDAVIDRPFPGLPKQPPAELADVAQFIVLSNGEPLLTDRGVGYFSGEEPKRINERADRKSIAATEPTNSQLVEITCDLKIAERDDRGKPNKLYTLSAVIDLLGCSEKFQPEWDRDSATSMVQRVFEWAGEHADTNPARSAMKEHNETYELKKAELTTVTDNLDELRKENLDLFKERSELAAYGAEYQLMQESRLFSAVELETPAETGRLAKDKEQTSRKALDSHNQMVEKRDTVYSNWKQFVAEHEVETSPENVLETIIQEETEARGTLDRLRLERNEVGTIGRSLKAATAVLREKHNSLKSRITRAEKALAKAAEFDTWFTGESPEGLETKVRAELKKSEDECFRLEKELSGLEDKLADIAEFKRRFGVDVDPVQWLQSRDTLCEKLREAKGEAFRGHRSRSAELEDLEKFSVAPGQFARDVQANVLVDFIPLHAAVEAMGFDEARKRTLLTLFSALLFAPVLPDAASAETAARNLAEKRLEFPVFVASDLERFCRGEDLKTINNSVRSLFIGVKTQNVDCLLDPELLERRKVNIRKILDGLTHKQKLLGKAIVRTSRESETVKLAARVCHAIDTHAIETAAQIKSLLDPLKESLTRLNVRASDPAVEAIRAMLDYSHALNGQTIEELKSDLASEAEKLAQAESNEAANDDAVTTMNSAIDSANDLLRDAEVKKNRQEPVLKSISVFLADTVYGLDFMGNAKTLEAALEKDLETATKKADFRFDAAQQFVDSGADRQNAIAIRLGEIEMQVPLLEERKLVLSPEVTSLMETGLVLTGNIVKVDGIARKMIRLYRRHRMSDLPAVDITNHNLYKEGRYIRNCTSVKECIARIAGLEDDIESAKESIEEVASRLKGSESEYKRMLLKYHDQIDNAVSDELLKLEEHVIIVLQQAKEDPTRIRGVLNAAKLNYEKDLAANEVAKQQLDIEWSTISNWLSEFTRRLPSNLDLMKHRFAPKKDKDQNLTSAGFIINAQVISHEDIEDVLRDIVRDIEDFEESQYLKNHSEIKKDNQASFRTNIRNKFYRRVILNPSIKVFIPSISRVKPLVLDKGIASSGQSVAISLLWIVKMSDYVSERERTRKTVSMSSLARKKMLAIKSQFVFIDGAFSHLSDRALIDDVLGEIANTRGRFQLIVTGHEREYKPNWKLFPTMLNGREVGDRFMFIEKGVQVEPGSVGSSYGAMSMMRTHVVKDVEVGDGSAAH